MATTDELLETAEEETEESTEYLVVSWDTREITIPSGIKILGVESDDSTTRLQFQCPAVYGEFDISVFSLRINYVNYNSSNSAQAKDTYYVQDAVSDGETITFSWLVKRNAYTSKGKTSFIVCGKVLDSDGNVVQEINTTPVSLTVLEGLETTEAIVAENADIIDQILDMLAQLSEEGLSSLTVTQILTEGTPIATISGTTIYAPSYDDGDEVSY